MTIGDRPLPEIADAAASVKLAADAARTLFETFTEGARAVIDRGLQVEAFGVPVKIGIPKA